jgi:hypothetical protein
MAGQDELARLEAERDRLLSMIAYHTRPKSPWLVAAVVILVCGVAGLVVASVGSVTGRIFTVVIFALSAYILARRITVFGIPARIFEIVTLTGSQTAGEPEIRQRLAECQAKILKLKEGRT